MNFDTLVLSSGGVNCFNTLGALQYLYDKKLLSNLNTFVGSSIGTMISYLMAINIEPSKCISYFMSNQLLMKLNKPDFFFLFNKKNGIFNYEIIENTLIDITLNQGKKLMTLKELYDMYEKTLIVCTYNLTQDKLEYLNYKTHPNLPCLTAVRMGCSAPIFFGDFYYMGDFYTDGAVIDYFPIDIPEIQGKNILGITSVKTENKYVKLELNNIFSYLEHILTLHTKNEYVNKLKKVLKEKNIKIIILNENKVYWGKLNVSNKFILDCFSFGYSFVKNLNCI